MRVAADLDAALCVADADADADTDTEVVIDFDADDVALAELDEDLTELLFAPESPLPSTTMLSYEPLMSPNEYCLAGA